MLFEMRLVGLAMDPFSNSPIVILKDRVSVEREEAAEAAKEAENADEQDDPEEADSEDEVMAVQELDNQLPPPEEPPEEPHEEQILPIWIGEAEAHAIATVLLKLSPPRPMTHDLLKESIVALGGSVNRIVVTELRENTFYAHIELALENGDVMTLDSRPSDAIALALRCDADIFVHESVLAQTRSEDGEQVKEDQFEELEEEKWKKLVENLSTDSLKKYEQ